MSAVCKEADGEDNGENRKAFLYMTVIGIGYLFPIAAIWAAFDYWKVLFPTKNVEFFVTGLYQLGSVVTVAILSVSKSFALRRRILTGFGGQAICLACLLCFRWLTLETDALFQLLLVIAGVLSIFTGYLDSALLSLCSQFSATMQQKLQIGIGLGTLVSVLYRDATKLFVSDDIKDATTAYFSVALATILVCISCYTRLMELPVAKHVQDTNTETPSGKQRLLDNPRSPNERLYCSPTGSPFVPSIAVPMSPAFDGTPEENEEADTKVLSTNSRKEANFTSVFRDIWMNQIVIFCHLLLTTLCYPGMITAIPCRDFISLRKGHWFQTLLLTSFTLSDIVARFLTHKRLFLTYRNIYYTVLIRLMVMPLIIYAATSDNMTDVMSSVIVGTFGFLNGYCVSLALMIVNEHPALDTIERKSICGRISACSINSGLCVGSLSAAALAQYLGLANAS